MFITWCYEGEDIILYTGFQLGKFMNVYKWAIWIQTNTEENNWWLYYYRKVFYFLNKHLSFYSKKQ